MAIPLIYDPRFQTWDDWASLMCEAYAGQQLMIPSGENGWKEWAAGLKAIDIFSNDAIPSPYIFDKWQDWVMAMVGIVNQPAETII